MVLRPGTPARGGGLSITAWAWLVLLFPLLGSIAVALGFRTISTRAAGAIGTAAIGLAFACGVAALIGLLGEAPEARHHASALWEYASAAGLQIKLGIFVDPLSIFMVLIVTGVSALIHLYSYGYMQSDEGYHRFFSYLNFFVFSMLLLVLAGNIVLLIVGWAFVGFASYALISFWYRRETATRAGMKAFVINVVGDIGLVLAAFLIFRELGTFEYSQVFARAPNVFHTNEWSVTAICLLLLVGAFAKSAQLPLHTWLPDAMEGPTPVSSLIHAATMVTAGVYLIARTHILFVLAPTAADIAAFVGLATLLVAGTIALVMTDLKRAIAYSTMSQIGYMIMGVSIGAYSAGLFHLMTHAFFKALLFMAAGSIIAAMGNEQNIDRMSGFGRAMRFTSATMLCGGLALAAFPGTSGFFSKDEILAYATARGGMYLIFTVLGYLGALLTAIYTFRLIFRILPGRPCKEAQELIDSGHVAHAHPFNPANGEEEDAGVGFPGPEHQIAEHSPPMKIAMGVLAFLALFAGFVQLPGVDAMVTGFLEPVFADSPLAAIRPSVAASWAGLGIGTAVSLTGIGIAYWLYVARPETPAALIRRLRPIHTFLLNKWYFDELIDVLVVRPALAVGRFADRTFERLVVDGLITGTEEVVGGTGRVVRTVQSGFVRSYALVLIAGFAGLALYFLLSSR
ncbi:MAG TPA: NADH-quinone oxidoreductase subunit L [Solirubrobacterales bacterium]|nr:NADH-quinone oxidoreductase subunit L [Solirubrobacterales bacterium]